MEPMPPAQDAPHAASRSGWPMTVGVITIIFGALGLLAGCAGVGFMLFIEPLTSALADASGQSIDSFGLAGMIEWKGWIVATTVVAALVALPLLAGGIGLTRRRSRSRPILVTWAIAKMALAAANGVLSLMVNRSQFDAAQENPVTAGMSAELSKMMSDGFTVVGVLWGWALPVFLLVWFSRRAIKEDMATWSDADHALPR